MSTPRCGDLLWSRVALKPSQVIQRSNLSATVVFLISIYRCEESAQIRVSHALHKWYNQIRSKEGSRDAHESRLEGGWIGKTWNL
jgi:hypothetical protein